MKNTDEFDASLFHRSISCNIFDHLGAHKKNDQIIFRVWAPHADEVWLVGDFNSWSHSHPMNKITEGGIWECSADHYSVKDRPLYKYKIKTGERIFYKADPFGRQMQTPPDTATVWYDADSPFGWTDNSWMKVKRKAFASGISSNPMNIYEVHPGSFMRHFDGSYMTYREIAPILASYVKKMSYTHVELMPVAEHQHDSSLGYDISGFYSVTSRFGSPDDLKFLINTLHNCGIGVIIDIVPSHFPCDEHGLFEFDGYRLYESHLTSADGSERYFDTSKTEVQSFLISNACYYAREFHADGLRIAGVRRMFCLDQGKSKDERTPDRREEKVSLESAAFIKKLNRSVKRLYPDVLMISDECASYKNPTHDGEDGLGFDLVWDASPLGAPLSIIKRPFGTHPYFEMTDAITSHKQNRVLSLSQSSLSLSTRSLMDRTEGSYESRFAQIRAFFTYYMTIPGKKLSFMSIEFGQFAPWQHSQSIEWFMLSYDMHRLLRDYSSDIGALYLSHPSLWENDNSPEGCTVITDPLTEHSYIVYKRHGKKGKDLYVILTLEDNVKNIVSTNIPDGNYRILISSAYKKYGGQWSNDKKTATVTNGTLHLDIAPFESLILEEE